MTEARRAHLHDPQTLYRHWEDGQWNPWDIDLSADRDQWQAMSDRSLVSFVLGSLIHHDERRHIAYGTWLLREAIAASPEMSDVVRDTLLEMLPAVAESLTPPEGADASVLGASAEELRAFALDGLTRLAIIGVGL